MSGVGVKSKRYRKNSTTWSDLTPTPEILTPTPEIWSDLTPTPEIRKTTVSDENS